MNVVAFDLDGTLEDSREDMVAAVMRVRAAHGLRALADPEVRPHVSRGMDALYRACLAELDGDARAPYEADYGAHLTDHTRLYPGIAGALDELSRLATLIVVTNKPEQLSRALLAALGIAHRFAAVIGGDSCAFAKPSPEPLLLGVARGGGRAGARVVMIGDSSADVLMGHACGATTLWCGWGYAASPAPAVPHHVAQRPEMLTPIVRATLGV